MQDYAMLYRSQYRIRMSYKQQVTTIRDLLAKGRSPLVTVLCIMVFLSTVRR